MQPGFGIAGAVGIMPGMIDAILRSGFLLLVLTGNALAAPQKETFRDWTASLDEVNTGEDLRRTCGASTSAVDFTSRTLALGIRIGNGDVLPPDAYPAISISSIGYDWPVGEAIRVTFGAGGAAVEMQAFSDGKQLMIDNVKETTLALLRAMAAGRSLDIVVADEPVPGLSLKGFTAAYRKLGAWCGFPTADVVK